MSNTRTYGPIWIDPERVGGVPCFTGTRVPVKNLFDYIGTGETVDTFLDDFPTVEKEQTEQVLSMAERMLSTGSLLDAFAA
jgi:uncharacterized protein (DUF433 family)